MEEENNITPEPVQEKKGINPIFILGGLVVVAAVAGVIVFGGKKQPQVEALNTQVKTPTQTTAAVSSGPVKEFTVDGTNYAFNPATITVSKGDTVKINFNDDDGVHNLVISGYNVATDTVSPGSSSSVTFVADKTGSFEYFCSVANHRDLGMIGTLVVQ